MEREPNIKAEKLETPFSPEEIEQFTAQIEEVVRLGERYLVQEHSDMLYHDPEHSIGDPDENGEYTEGGVRRGAEAIAEAQVEAFDDAFIPAAIKQTAVLAARVGMTFHDTAMNISAVNEAGMVVRKRAFGEGGNEYESYLLMRRALLDVRHPDLVQRHDGDYDAAYQELIDPSSESFDRLFLVFDEQVQDLFEATTPDTFDFGHRVSVESIPYSSDTKRRLHEAGFVDEENTVGAILIDSPTTRTSGLGNAGGTADLIASLARPEIGIRKGFEELFELFVGLSRQCLKIDQLPADELKQAKDQVLGWAKTQVSIPIGQRYRMDKNVETTQLYKTITGQHAGEENDVPENFKANAAAYRAKIHPFTASDEETVNRALDMYLTISSAVEEIDAAITKGDMDTARGLFKTLIFETVGMTEERLQKYVDRIAASGVPGSEQLQA